MKTWNCDRCGNNFVKPLVAEYKIYGLFGEIDLCSKCNKEFKEWLDNKENDNDK
jgi:DNA-directed RNA polymerase subunit RPC12/RpoP